VRLKSEIKSCCEELRYLHSSLSIIRIIKSRLMGWAGHVASMDEKRNAYGILVGKSEGETNRKTYTWVGG
jgi:hypothetical protein